MPESWSPSYELIELVHSSRHQEKFVCPKEVEKVCLELQRALVCIFRGAVQEFYNLYSLPNWKSLGYFFQCIRILLISFLLEQSKNTEYFLKRYIISALLEYTHLNTTQYDCDRISRLSGTHSKTIVLDIHYFLNSLRIFSYFVSIITVN